MSLRVKNLLVCHMNAQEVYCDFSQVLRDFKFSFCVDYRDRLVVLFKEGPTIFAFFQVSLKLLPRFWGQFIFQIVNNEPINLLARKHWPKQAVKFLYQVHTYICRGSGLIEVLF